MIIKGDEFKSCINQYFAPFLFESGLVLTSDIFISGKYYSASFESVELSLSISYETGDDYLDIRLSDRKSRVASDEEILTVTLSELNRRYMSSVPIEELQENELRFKGVYAATPEVERMLKCAKALRICLQKFGQRLQPQGGFDLTDGSAA